MLKKHKWIFFILFALTVILIATGRIIFIELDGSVPFSVSYHSWLESPLVIFMMFWILTAGIITLIPGEKYSTLKKAVFWLSFSFDFIVGLSFLTYHVRYHNYPAVLAFNDYEPVVPFHVQLAKTYFVFSVTSNVLLLLASKVSFIFRYLLLLVSVFFLVFVSL